VGQEKAASEKKRKALAAKNRLQLPCHTDHLAGRGFAPDGVRQDHQRVLKTGWRCSPRSTGVALSLRGVSRYHLPFPAYSFG
jgi:hypothetical protein